MSTQTTAGLKSVREKRQFDLLTISLYIGLIQFSCEEVYKLNPICVWERLCKILFRNKSNSREKQLYCIIFFSLSSIEPAPTFDRFLYKYQGSA